MLSLFLESHLEEKRQRLLAKVELAKQGWTGVSSASKEASTSKSAPQIDSRPPIGNLPAFIPLGGDSSSEEEAEPIYATLKEVSEAAVDVGGTGEQKEEEQKEDGVDERLI